MTKQTDKTPAPTAVTEAAKPTVDEVLDSMTGQEELDLWEAFQGQTLQTVNWTKRHSIFLLKRREGVTIADAKAAVLQMPASELDDYFGVEDEDEDDPDEPQPLGKPETEAGKGDEPLER